MKAKDCEKCVHFSWNDIMRGYPRYSCGKGHYPRCYMNEYDLDAPWIKRRCDDYEEKK